MPIITFHGLEEKRIKEYYDEKIDEICDLVKASKDNVFFVMGQEKVLNPKKTAYITVEWIRRIDKEQLLTNHLRNYFAKDVEKTAIFYTDVNGKLYLDGNKLG